MPFPFTLNSNCSGFYQGEGGGNLPRKKQQPSDVLNKMQTSKCRQEPEGRAIFAKPPWPVLPCLFCCGDELWMTIYPRFYEPSPLSSFHPLREILSSKLYTENTQFCAERSYIMRLFPTKLCSGY